MAVTTPTQRLRFVAAALGAAALASAGLAMLAAGSTQAAPAPKPASERTSYRGAPVNPAPYTVTQPDGSTVRVRDLGDHLQHWTATVTGNYTVVRGSDGVYRYASGLTSSGKLKPSGVAAGQGAAPAAAQGLEPAPIAKASQNSTPLGGTGDDRELVILVEFSDVTHHATGSTEADWANHYFGATGSVDDFYEEASQDQFGLAPASESCGSTSNDGVTGWIPLPYPHPNTGVDSNATDQYVADAIKATEGCVDWASYDTAPADGQIETNELHVTVIGAGFETSYGGSACGKSIWGHEWDLASAGVTAPTVDGVTVGNSGYTTFGEWHCSGSDNPGHKATIGIMAHEFGHDINWPDLYDTDRSGEGIGEWSLMGSGSWGRSSGGALPGDSPSYPDAYSLYYQHWITPTPITTPTDNIAVAAHQSLLLGPNPGGADWLFRVHSGAGEFFMLENRSRHGYDTSTPGCGIVVYRIDETVTPSNVANADETDPLVAVIQADGRKDLELRTNRGDGGDPYPGTAANHDLADATTPNSRFHDGTASNLALHVDESACADTMHVDVTHVGGSSPTPVRPANDSFVDAVTAAGDNGNTTGTSVNATTEPGEPVPAAHGAASVWYRWTPSVSGTATLTMAGSDFDTVLGVYVGSAVNALTPVAVNDDEDYGAGIVTSRLQTHVTGGTTYRIAADGYDGDTGTVKLAWSLAPDVTPPPAKLATTTTASAPHKVRFKKDFDVTAHVTAGATGTVTVTDGSKVLGSGTLSNGAVRIHVTTNLRAGKHTLRVSYGGSATAMASSTTVAVKIVKKRRHH